MILTPFLSRTYFLFYPSNHFIGRIKAKLYTFIYLLAYYLTFFLPFAFLSAFETYLPFVLPFCPEVFPFFLPLPCFCVLLSFFLEFEVLLFPVSFVLSVLLFFVFWCFLSHFSSRQCSFLGAIRQPSSKPIRSVRPALSKLL